jgi:putative transcriptional regulator
MALLLDDKIAPGFLVAPPPMGDPNFDHTVILMTMHDDDGSLGFVINRKCDISLHTLMRALEIEPGNTDKPVLVGGPVSGTTGFVLYEHPKGDPAAPGMTVSQTISLSPSKDVLAAAARGVFQSRFELLLGYSGWGPGQLVKEIERGSWLYIPFDADLLFDVPMEERWEEAYRRLGVSPMGFTNVPGGAMA